MRGRGDEAAPATEEGADGLLLLRRQVGREEAEDLEVVQACLDRVTGAVKVTPAHDPVDFELGKEHGLEQIIVIDGAGRMTEAAGATFQGLDRFEEFCKTL